MADFSYSSTFSAGNVIVADDVMGHFNAVRNFVVGSNLDADNLSTPFANFTITFQMGDITDGNNEQRRFRVPASQQITWVEAQVARSDGGGTATLTVTDQGTGGGGTTAVLSSGLANSSANSTSYTTGFNSSTTNAGSYVLVQTASSGTSNDVHVTLWGKIKIRS